MKSFMIVIISLCLSSLLYSSEKATNQAGSLLDRMPLSFIENQGQIGEEVAFTLNGADKSLFFTDQGVTFALQGNLDDKKTRWIMKLDFIDAQRVAPRGLEKQATRVNYFRGKPEDWQTGIGTYSKLIYEDLWPGIDLVYSGTRRQLKYEFVVRPGADPDRIRLLYRGVESVSLDDQGALQVSTPLSRLEDGIPYAYQMTDGEPVEVSMAYARIERQAEDAFSYGFELGAYDPQKPLVLDPLLLVYCGYIGGGDDEWGEDSGRCIAVDHEGSAYVAGETVCPESHFPVVVGPDLTFNGWYDAFVAKVNAAGTHLDYCGYIGGGESDFILGIAVDDQGSAYVTGYTQSSETSGFPVTVGPDLTFNDSFYSLDGFVAKVNAAGTRLDYCGYIGGSGQELILDLALDGAGNAYVAGYTESTEADFPVVTGPDLTYNGGEDDAFVARVNHAGTHLDYCGYIGGNNWDRASGIAVDETGRAYVTGSSDSPETGGFPVLVGPDLTYNGGELDGYVARVNASGTALEYCGYLGGDDRDECVGIVVDHQDNVYLVGTTKSSERSFPVLIGPDLTFNGGPFYYDAFVAKVNASGTALDYCGYIGGTEMDEGKCIGVDGNGRCYVAGETQSSATEGFPILIGPDLTHNNGDDCFLVRVNALGDGLDYCGYLGGASNDIPYDLDLDSFNNVYLAGYTYSTESSFPVVVGPDLTFNDAFFVADCFVAKVAWALAADADTLPVSTGSQIRFALTAGPENAFRTYVILGSRSGSNPGIPLPGGGVTLPINWDPFTNFVINKLNSNLFSNFLGILDQYGRGTATLNTGPLKPGIIGDITTFAFCLEGSPDWDFASNPMEIEFVP